MADQEDSSQQKLGRRSRLFGQEEVVILCKCFDFG